MLDSSVARGQIYWSTTLNRYCLIIRSDIGKGFSGVITSKEITFCEPEGYGSAMIKQADTVAGMLDEEQLSQIISQLS